MTDWLHNYEHVDHEGVWTQVVNGRVYDSRGRLVGHVDPEGLPGVEGPPGEPEVTIDAEHP